ncbi:MAG: arginase family protein, partial [Candidatus Heimdallarchaeota archaeon]|nr:arginase family protein [Candidatus Heimdallarchaeota archaeon]
KSKYSHGSPLGRAIELENIDPSNCLIIGTRYLTQIEQQIIENNKINEFKMHDIEQSDFNMNIFQEKILEIAKNVDHIYVSIDIDVLDPAFAPGTGTPVGGGMSTSQLMQFISAIPIKIRAFDLMEISPPLDHSGITLKAAMGIFTELLAQIKTQY